MHPGILLAGEEKHSNRRKKIPVQLHETYITENPCKLTFPLLFVLVTREEQGNKRTSKMQPAFHCEERMMLHTQQTLVASCSVVFGFFYCRKVIVSSQGEKKKKKEIKESSNGKEKE